MVDKRHEARNTKLEKALQAAQQVPCNASECKQKSAIESLQQELAEARRKLEVARKALSSLVNLGEISASETDSAWMYCEVSKKDIKAGRKALSLLSNVEE